MVQLYANEVPDEATAVAKMLARVVLEESSDAPVVGSIDGLHFKLWKNPKHHRIPRTPIRYRNSFTPVFCGTIERIEPSGDGAPARSLVRGHFRLNLFVRVFFTLWMAAVIAICLGFAGVMIAGVDMDLSALGVPCMMVVIALGAYGLGRSLSAGEKAEIIGFLDLALGRAADK